MRYIAKIDPNGRQINEAINSLKRVDVPTDAVLTNYSVSVPFGAYGVTVKKSPFEFEMKINDNDSIPVDIGDYWSPFAAGIDTITITTTQTGTEPIVLVFIV
jgi:hypothetical protein